MLAGAVGNLAMASPSHDVEDEAVGLFEECRTHIGAWAASIAEGLRLFARAARLSFCSPAVRGECRRFLKVEAVTLLCVLVVALLTIVPIASLLVSVWFYFFARREDSLRELLYLSNFWLLHLLCVAANGVHILLLQYVFYERLENCFFQVMQASVGDEACDGEHPQRQRDLIAALQALPLPSCWVVLRAQAWRVLKEAALAAILLLFWCLPRLGFLVYPTVQLVFTYRKFGYTASPRLGALRAGSIFLLTCIPGPTRSYVAWSVQVFSATLGLCRELLDPALSRLANWPGHSHGAEGDQHPASGDDPSSEADEGLRRRRGAAAASGDSAAKGEDELVELKRTAAKWKLTRRQHEGLLLGFGLPCMAVLGMPIVGSVAWLVVYSAAAVLFVRLYTPAAPVGAQ